MHTSIAILSSDEIFSRMLELEFLLYQMEVSVIRDAKEAFHADVVLLDLDTVSAPLNAVYHQMIGFTRSSALSADDARRQCSMILHRPFEINSLRREVFDILSQMRAEERAIALDERCLPRKYQNELTLKNGSLYYGDRQIALSKRELQIMEVLLSNKGDAVTREVISEVIGESAANKVDVYICYLRRKLEQVSHSRLITTVRGKGYRLL